MNLLEGLHVSYCQLKYKVQNKHCVNREYIFFIA